MNNPVKTWKVNFFQTQRENCPVKEFIEDQDKTTITRINLSIRLLIDYGPFLKPPDIKKLQDELYELRIPGKPSVRIFYTMIKGEYYLLHAFKKKSQKTPPKELKVAINRMKGL